MLGPLIFTNHVKLRTCILTVATNMWLHMATPQHYLYNYTTAVLQRFNCLACEEWLHQRCTVGANSVSHAVCFLSEQTPIAIKLSSWSNLKSRETSQKIFSLKIKKKYRVDWWCNCVHCVSHTHVPLCNHRSIPH